MEDQVLDVPGNLLPSIKMQTPSKLIYQCTIPQPCAHINRSMLHHLRELARAFQNSNPLSKQQLVAHQLAMATWGNLQLKDSPLAMEVRVFWLSLPQVCLHHRLDGVPESGDNHLALQLFSNRA